jgi:hypothetical protein
MTLLNDLVCLSVTSGTCLFANSCVGDQSDIVDEITSRVLDGVCHVLLDMMGITTNDLVWHDSLAQTDFLRVFTACISRGDQSVLMEYAIAATEPRTELNLLTYLCIIPQAIERERLSSTVSAGAVEPFYLAILFDSEPSIWFTNFRINDVIDRSDALVFVLQYTSHDLGRVLGSCSSHHQCAGFVMSVQAFIDSRLSDTVSLFADVLLEAEFAFRARKRRKLTRVSYDVIIPDNDNSISWSSCVALGLFRIGVDDHEPLRISCEHIAYLLRAATKSLVAGSAHIWRTTCARTDKLKCILWSNNALMTFTDDTEDKSCRFALVLASIFYFEMVRNCLAMGTDHCLYLPFFELKLNGSSRPSDDCLLQNVQLMKCAKWSLLLTILSVFGDVQMLRRMQHIAKSGVIRDADSSTDSTSIWSDLEKLAAMGIAQCGGLRHDFGFILNGDSNLHTDLYACFRDQPNAGSLCNNVHITCDERGEFETDEAAFRFFEERVGELLTTAHQLRFAQALSYLRWGNPEPQRFAMILEWLLEPREKKLSIHTKFATICGAMTAARTHTEYQCHPMLADYISGSRRFRKYVKPPTCEPTTRGLAILQLYQGVCSTLNSFLETERLSDYEAKAEMLSGQGFEAMRLIVDMSRNMDAVPPGNTITATELTKISQAEQVLRNADILQRVRDSMHSLLSKQDVPFALKAVITETKSVVHAYFNTAESTSHSSHAVVLTHSEQQKELLFSEMCSSLAARLDKSQQLISASISESYAAGAVETCCSNAISRSSTIFREHSVKLMRRKNVVMRRKFQADMVAPMLRLQQLDQVFGTHKKLIIEKELRITEEKNAQTDAIVTVEESNRRKGILNAHISELQTDHETQLETATKDFESVTTRIHERLQATRDNVRSHKKLFAQKCIQYGGLDNFLQSSGTTANVITSIFESRQRDNDWGILKACSKHAASVKLLGQNLNDANDTFAHVRMLVQNELDKTYATSFSGINNIVQKKVAEWNRQTLKTILALKQDFELLGVSVSDLEKLLRAEMHSDLCASWNKRILDSHTLRNNSSNTAGLSTQKHVLAHFQQVADVLMDAYVELNRILSTAPDPIDVFIRDTWETELAPRFGSSLEAVDQIIAATVTDQDMWSTVLDMQISSSEEYSGHVEAKQRITSTIDSAREMVTRVRSGADGWMVIKQKTFDLRTRRQEQLQPYTSKLVDEIMNIQHFITMERVKTHSYNFTASEHASAQIMTLHNETLWYNHLNAFTLTTSCTSEHQYSSSEAHVVRSMAEVLHNVTSRRYMVLIFASNEQQDSNIRKYCTDQNALSMRTSTACQVRGVLLTSENAAMRSVDDSHGQPDQALSNIVFGIATEGVLPVSIKTLWIACQHHGPEINIETRLAVCQVISNFMFDIWMYGMRCPPAEQLISMLYISNEHEAPCKMLFAWPTSSAVVEPRQTTTHIRFYTADASSTEWYQETQCDLQAYLQVLLEIVSPHLSLENLQQDTATERMWECLEAKTKEIQNKELQREHLVCLPFWKALESLWPDSDQLQYTRPSLPVIVRQVMLAFQSIDLSKADNMKSLAVQSKLWNEN